MRPAMKATDEHAAKVKADALAMLDRLGFDGMGEAWPDTATKREAFAMHRAATGIKMDLICPSCSTTVIDWLRTFRDLPPIAKAASHRLHEKRLAVCRGTAGDGSDACEHLSWPGLNCSVCLCFVDLKARLKKSKCPEGKW